MKKVLELIYTATYNFDVKKNGYSPSSHLVASMLTGLVILFFVINITTLLIILTKNQYYANFGKGTAMLFLILFFGFIYLLLFNIFHFSKNGDTENYLFQIEPRTYLITWTAITVNFILLFLLWLLKTIILKQY